MENKTKRTYTGSFMATTKGFGFVRVDELDDDIFVPERRQAGAMDGDTVRVVLTKNKKKNKAYEGEIEKVIIRNTTTLVGTFDKSSKFTFVIPDNQKLSDIYIPKGKTSGAKNGRQSSVPTKNEEPAPPIRSPTASRKYGSNSNSKCRG